MIFGRTVVPSFRPVLASLALTAISLGAQAQNVAASTLPVDPLGKQWWQLYNSIPLSLRDRLGETPTACALGQNGNVWLLNTAGDGSTPVTRRCTVPRNTQIFLPIITAFCVPFPGETIADNIQLCTDLIEPFNKLTLTIDGKNRHDLIERRAQSQAFPMWLPEDNIFDIPGENTPAGIYTAVTEGYYALIQSLPVGRHTIHAKAVATKNPEIPAFEYTYIINVVKPTGVVPN